ncbi:MAG TPA: hypothetical protein VK891_05035, partial [Euzebyales bacterium]|nr:hypothetical protein [Euzebyales bacterium]
MRVAFVGKGGSGKTTLSSLFTRVLADKGLPVLAIDADINQHLGVALGLDPERAARLPALGAHLDALREHLRGDNPRIAAAVQMIKTTPPGRGSRLLRCTGGDPLVDALAHEVDGLRLLVTGPFDTADLGVACYHAKTGAVELLLNHMVDGVDEYVVVDMTAGADAFASGLFTRFDLTVMVVEPTRRAVGVFDQYAEYARGYDVRLAAVGNKVHGDGDVAFLREHLGDALLTWVDHSDHVRAADRGQERPLDLLEPENRSALEEVRAALDACTRDWRAYQRHSNEFHRRNAAAWGNA